MLGGAFARLSLAAKFNHDEHGQHLPTPADPTGPFYPLPTQWPAAVGSDLLTMQGRLYPHGTSLRLSGRVFSESGEALAARVELWQCDEQGLYRHPKGDGEGPAQRGFHGFGAVTTASDGGYMFRTIKPVPYSGRPAHIHLKVQAQGYQELTTQLYIDGANEETVWLYRVFGGFSKERSRLTMQLAPSSSRDDTALQGLFDIVLRRA
jgi:protocatechuate 3,4-dioxygenase, beta subunit